MTSLCCLSFGYTRSLHCIHSSAPQLECEMCVLTATSLPSGIRRFQLDQIICKLVSSKLIIFSKHESPTMSLLYLWFGFLLSEHSHNIHRPLWLFRIASFAGHLCHLVVKIQISWHVFSIRSKRMDMVAKLLNLPKPTLPFRVNLGHLSVLFSVVSTILLRKLGSLGHAISLSAITFSLVIPLGRGQERALAKFIRETGKVLRKPNLLTFVLFCTAKGKKKFLLK